MKIVSLLGRKGGITKTTLAVNLAAGCALAGLRTVLIDADGQANSTQIVRHKPAPGLFDLLLGDKEFKDVLLPVGTKFTGAEVELYLLPNNDSARQVEEYSDTASLIVERFADLDGWADVVIVDTAPSITNVHAGVYYASDYVLLPTVLEPSAITSLASTLSYLNSAAQAGREAGYGVAQVLGIIPNRFAAAEKVQQANLGFLHGRYDPHYTVFDPMRNLTVWNQATQLKTCIFAYQPEDDYNARKMAKAAVRELTWNMKDGDRVPGPLSTVLGLFEVALA